MYISELGEVIKMQIKPVREQHVYDNTLYFQLCIRLQVICVAVTSLVSLLRRLKYNSVPCYL